jgi:hypothetical protein
VKAASTMTAVEQWQWFLSLRRGSERFPVLSETPHGTPTGYQSRGCRCDECRAAWNKYAAPYRKAWVEKNREHVRMYQREYQRALRARQKDEAAK